MDQDPTRPGDRIAMKRQATSDSEERVVHKARPVVRPAVIVQAKYKAMPKRKVALVPRPPSRPPTELELLGRRLDDLIAVCEWDGLDEDEVDSVSSYNSSSSSAAPLQGAAEACEAVSAAAAAHGAKARAVGTETGVVAAPALSAAPLASPSTPQADDAAAKRGSTTHPEAATATEPPFLAELDGTNLE